MRASSWMFGVALVALGVVAGILGARACEGRHEGDEGKGEHEAAKGGDEAKGEEEPKGSVLVSTAEVKEEEMRATVEGVGAAVVPPDAVTSVTWNSEIVAVKALVGPGQAVEKDAPLVQAAPSRDAALALTLAQQAVESTGRALETATQRVERGLATKTEQIAAESAAAEAKEKLARARAGMLPADGMIRAPEGGVVQAVRAQPGAVVAPNAPIVDVAVAGRVVAQVGVEPLEAGLIKPGQGVKVKPIGAGENGAYEAVVSLVGPAVNPTTHLVDVTAEFRGDARPRPGAVLLAVFAVPAGSALTVAREAIVPEGDEEVVFVAREGKAVRVEVRTGRRRAGRVEIEKGLRVGDRVIVSGLSQLSDSVAVREETSVEGH